MFLRRLAQTAGAVAAVAFCADTNRPTSQSKFQRQNSSPAQQVKFRSFASEVSGRAQKLLSDDDWKLYQTSKDVKVSHKKSPDHSGEVYRVDLIVDYPVDRVDDVLVALNKRVDWDPDVKNHIIEELGEGITILHATYEVSGLAAKIMSPRDFCRIELIDRHDNGLISMAYDNIEHPGCQPLNGFVRGQMFTSGMFIEPYKDDPKKTHVIFIYQSDAKVYVPAYLVHWTTCRRGFEMADEIKEAIEKDKKQE
ncbi:stAR-related lipid transfer protein 5-like [Amphiura filiformis]|uniref:stAR-related lipid transfer protein 5-like n=1 Tax=Amphiura filiformis TaxID=82378 RepID=UPI003B2103C0